jgi:hypothetical protein
LKINYILHDVIEGQMTELKGVGKRRRGSLMIWETEEDIGS